MVSIANCFLLAFLADGLLALAGPALAGLAPAGAVDLASRLAGLLVALSAPAVYLLLGVSPRLPKRVFLPLTLYVLWAALTGIPLSLWVGTGAAARGLAAGQVALGVAALLWVRRRSGGRSCLLTPDLLAGPAFRWRTAAGFVAGNLFLLVPSLALYLALGVTLTAHRLTAGFVSVGPAGVSTEERVYTREAETVHLIGMVHIGQQAFFDQVLASLRGTRGVVLAEGVSDARGLIRQAFSYRGLAAGLGLDSQEEFPIPAGSYAVEHADVDVSEFSPATVELLNAAAELLSQGSLAGLGEAYGRLAAVAARPGVLEAVERELVELRNRRLLERLETSLERYDRVVVPWGAAHMPGIERGVLEQGFRLARSRRLAVVEF